MEIQEKVSDLHYEIERIMFKHSSIITNDKLKAVIDYKGFKLKYALYSIFFYFAYRDYLNELKLLFEKSTQPDFEQQKKALMSKWNVVLYLPPHSFPWIIYANIANERLIVRLLYKNMVLLFHVLNITLWVLLPFCSNMKWYMAILLWVGITVLMNKWDKSYAKRFNV